MKAVIQAGGKGTRLLEITNNLYPKPMIKIGNIPLLEHQLLNLREFGIREIFIIVGYLGQKIIDYFGSGAKLNLDIKYIIEDQNNLLGTGGSLFYLKKELNDDFIFILGDVFINIDFERMIKFHYSKNSLATLFAHPNSHPYDSDLIILDNDSRVLRFDYKTNDRSKYYYPNCVNAGVMIFSKETLKKFNSLQKISYENLLVIPSIIKGRCYGYKSSEYVKDIGTPERYHAVCNDFINKLPQKRRLTNKQKCIFVDRDGTLNKYVGFLKNINDFELLDRVSDAIKIINNSDYLIIVITNQPVVARGEVTLNELNNIHNKMSTLLGNQGAFINDLYYCPHHPEKGFKNEIKELKIDCNCRKPKTGLIEKAILYYNIDAAKSFFIGDSTIDIKCAQNANIKSVLVKTGLHGNDLKYDVKADYICDDLYDFIKTCLKELKND